MRMQGQRGPDNVQIERRDSLVAEDVVAADLSEVQLHPWRVKVEGYAVGGHVVAENALELVE